MGFSSLGEEGLKVLYTYLRSVFALRGETPGAPGIDVPTKVSELENDAGYVDGAALEAAVAELAQSIGGAYLRKDFIEGTDGGNRLVKDIAFAVSGGSVTATAYYVNPLDGAEQQLTKTMPLASGDNAGLMPKESFAAISELWAVLESLKGLGRVAARLGLTPAQADLTAAWVAAKGAEPTDGATVENLDQDAPSGHAWTFLTDAEGTGAWYDRGTDTVNVATNSAVGVVKGATEAGKVFVENDGSMSLVGYDALKDGIEEVAESLGGYIEKTDVATADQVLAALAEVDGGL